MRRPELITGFVFAFQVICCLCPCRAIRSGGTAELRAWTPKGRDGNVEQMFYIKHLKAVLFFFFCPQTITPASIIKNLPNQHWCYRPGFLSAIPSSPPTAHKRLLQAAPPLPLDLSLLWRSRWQQGSPLCVCRHRGVDGHHAVVCCQKGDGRVPEKQVPRRIIRPRNAGWDSVLLHVVQGHILSCKGIFSPHS